MSLWTLKEIAAALGVEAPEADTAVNGVSIDTRTLQPGDLFVALSGKPTGGFKSSFESSRDGHEFVRAAEAAGAAAALVDHKIEGVGIPQLVVADTLMDGLWKLGAAARARFRGKVIGLTGSAGKTTTKEMLVAGLGAPSTSGPGWGGGSFNNFWGVPLTMCRLDPTAPYWVIEMGMNQPGEIARLSRLAKPDVALVVNVKPVHVAGLGGLEAVRREKLDIAKGLEAGGVLVVPEDLSLAGIDFAGTVLRFGIEKGDVWAMSHHAHGGDWHVRADVDGTMAEFMLWEGAPHRLHNALAALACVAAAGGDVAEAAKAIGSVAPLNGRGASSEVGGVLVIDDSFNGNPASMAAALEGLAGRQVVGRKYAVLGDMLELGADEVAYHKGLLDKVLPLDGAYLVGPLMKNLYDLLPPEKRLGYVKNPAEFDPADFAKRLKLGDAVVVKGSKKMLFVHKAVERLKAALSLASS
jgi:UDP-N-acetylmuramoyl-tripeptide--D-alanyl-D-alanine ligase